MKKKLMPVVFCVSFLLASAGMWSAKSWVKIKEFSPRPITFPASLREMDSFIEVQEKPFMLELRDPSLRKRIVWQTPNKIKTPFSILYLHGFSASPMEMTPIPEKIAEAMRANLYLPRLTGHGTKNGLDLLNTKPQSWLQDAFEAFEVARRLGDEVIIIGNSMGAALTLWLTSQQYGRVHSQVLLSPYFKLNHPIGAFMDTHVGYQIARSFSGNWRNLHPQNALQELYWTTTYPLRAVGNTTALVKYLSKNIDYSRVQVPTQVVYTHHDKTVDSKAIENRFTRIGSSLKVLVPFDDSNQHVLAGDAIQKEQNLVLIDNILRFIRRENLGN